MRSLPTTYHQFLSRLSHIYGQDEARSILRLTLEKTLGMAWADVLCTDFAKLPQEQLSTIEDIMVRLERQEPIQYVMGEAEFCGHTFAVDSHVLIPRPETEELVRAMESHTDLTDSATILDIGTGSGCIAITLAIDHPSWQVSAWDNSSLALLVAQKNANTYGTKNVHFSKVDILSCVAQPTDHWDVIIANPPYVCQSEKVSMEKNVLAYEPASSLFVTDDSPLLFYEAILRYAKSALSPCGMVFVEINSRFGSEVANLFSCYGFSSVSLLQDQFSHDRIVFGKR